MFIQEAVEARTNEKPYITRVAWGYADWANLKIQPTNTPDCCVLITKSARRPVRGWQPQMTDLIADDWVTTE